MTFQTIDSKVQIILATCTRPVNSAQCYFQHTTILSPHFYLSILDHVPWCISDTVSLFKGYSALGFIILVTRHVGDLTDWMFRFYESVSSISKLSVTSVTNIDSAASKNKYGIIMGISPSYHQLESSKSVFLDWFIFTCLFVFITV